MVASNPVPSLGVSLAGRSIGRFTVERLLGAGGMGEVYRAQDTTLKRPVALKRVAPQLRNDPRSRKRILKEAERASALNSPHIAAIYDVLQENNEVFLVMEYVEGVTLREHMHAAALDTQTFLNIAAQCAEALASAHQKRIVHGDIKPENIMITADGTVKVLDFGLAKRLASGEAAPLDSTQSAVLSGTPGYIAPEILLAQDADARSDIFSLGVVLYEALTRQHPFTGKTFTEAADKTLHHTPAPLHEVVPTAPAELEGVIGKMMAKDPAERYVTAADLLVELRALQQGTTAVSLTPPRVRSWARRVGRIVAAVLILLIVVSALPDVRRQWKRWFIGPDLPEKKNLVVLPFVSVNKEAQAQALAQGLTYILTSNLAKLTDRYPLQVIRPAFAGTVNKFDQAREAGASLVLEGSSQQSGSTLRITYSLVDAKSRRQLRADDITAEVSDLIRVENRVVDSVLRSLEVELTVSDRKLLAAHGTSSREAYESYMRARGYLENYQNPENVESAISEFNTALQRDPNFALAYAGLGESYWHKYNITKATEWIGSAQENCSKAESITAGQDCLGTIYNGTGRYQDAVRQFQLALKHNPTDDDAYRGLAYAYERQGNVVEAEQTFRSAINMRPQYWASYNWLGIFYLRHHRYQQAAEMYQQVTNLAPDNFRGYANLCSAYLVMARYSDALAACQRSIVARINASAFNNMGVVYFYQRRFDDAARASQDALKVEPNNRIAWANLAEVYYWTGRKQESADAYRKAIDLGEQELRVNPQNAALLSYLGLYHAVLGKRAVATAYRDKALAVDSGSVDVLFNAAIITNVIGDSDAALSWLEKALDAGLTPEFAQATPYFEKLRSSKRFQALLQRSRLKGS